MKNIFYIPICCLLLACTQERKTETNATPKDTLQQSVIKNQTIQIIKPTSVTSIKQVYAATIMQLESGELDSVSYNYNCHQERSGKISYYTKNGKLVMMSHSYNEYDHFEATDRYFVNDDRLYFAHLNQLVWSFVSGAGEGATKDDITENRIYLVKDQPILCLEKKFTVRKKANDNPKPNEVANKVVNCKSAQKLLNNFKSLVLFKDKTNKECL